MSRARFKNGHARAWLYFVAAMLMGVALYFSIPTIRGTEFVVAWLGGAWAVTQFYHQHELEKNRFFLELFKGFNERYDKMNEELAGLALKGEELHGADRALVVDYFNLCAEEYLFYVTGYVPQDVWHAWSNGMKWYAGKQNFRKVWHEERTTDSYYGFDLLKLV